MESTRRAARIVVLAGVLATVALVVAAFAPLQRSTSSVTDSTGLMQTTSDNRSLMDDQGPSILLVAALPAVVALVPLLAAWRRKPRLFRQMLVASTVLVALFVVATGFSIGLLYVPALVALMVAASRPRQRPSTADAP